MEQTAREVKEEELPGNAILMPSVNPQLAALRRKRTFKRVRKVIFFLLIPLVVLFIYSGTYQYVSMWFRDGFESLRIAFTSSSGYPADFQMAGFIKSENMGDKGFAVLGKKDLSIYSSDGQELSRIQHTYPNPGISVSDTRVCLYQRGGKEFVVEGRSGTIARRSTENEILFTQMSDSGWLAVATSSRHRATVEVYSPLYPEDQPYMRWKLDDEKPVAAAFHSDNKTLALGCLSTKGGALGTTVYVQRTDRKNPQCTIWAEDACLLKLEFISSNRVLAVYDWYTALYNTQGEELARYDYEGKQLMCADSSRGRTALLFGSSSQQTVELVVLDGDLAPLFTTSAESAQNMQVLLDRNGVFLLSGQEVSAYNFTGQQTGALAPDAKIYGLVQGGQPLALTAGSALPLSDLLRVSSAEDAASQQSAASEPLPEQDLGEADPQPEESPEEQEDPQPEEQPLDDEQEAPEEPGEEEPFG